MVVAARFAHQRSFGPAGRNIPGADAAFDRFETCLRSISSAQLLPPTAFVVEGSRGHNAAAACRDAEIRFIDDARLQQNQHVLYVDAFGDEQADAVTTTTSISAE